MTNKAIRLLRSSLRRAVTRFPILTEPVGRIWNTYEHAIFTYSAWKNTRRRRSDPAPVDPYLVIRLDPNWIDYHSPGGFDFLSDSGVVKGGDWDQRDKKAIEDRFRYQSFHERFVEGRSWEETEFYRRKVEKIRSDRSAKYESVEALDRKCAELDDLYHDLKTNGYQTQEELADERNSMRYVGDGGPGLVPWTTDSIVRHEISIDVARDGEPLLNEGRHRLCIAKILDLESIPVRVVARHEKWQDLRNEIAVYLDSATNVPSKEDAIESVLEQKLRTDDVAIEANHPDLLAITENRDT